MAAAHQTPATDHSLARGGDSDGRRPHLVLVPMMASGHTIPMVDMAILLADRGAAAVTFVTTPVNAARIRHVIDSVESSGLPITFLSLPFPAASFGLPDGCENFDLLPSRQLAPNFLDATRSLGGPLTNHLRTAAAARPTCIISDVLHAWTLDVARGLGVPRLVFNGTGCIGLLCFHVIRKHKLLDGGDEEDAAWAGERLVLPGMPDRVELSRAQMPGFRSVVTSSKYREECRAAEAASDGVVVNSFDELEPTYREWCEEAMGMKVWTIGPMLLSNSDMAAGRGNWSTIDEEVCLKWLGSSMEPGSVIYASFGSMLHTGLPQLVEIGLGLEAANFPFVWVIKVGNMEAEVEEWLTGGGGGGRGGFEERVKGRGLIIRGWAPQRMILGHPAVGGFVTHCGWNSALEAVVAGVPMVTWPHFAEQFVNEKLVVDILRIGVAVGVKSGVGWRDEATAAVAVERGEVETAVRKLMDREGEGEGMRERVRSLRDKARKAVEAGGSSYGNFIDLVHHHTKHE